MTTNGSISEILDDTVEVGTNYAENSGNLIIMMDTESLGLKPDSIVRQISFIAVESADLENPIRVVDEFLPLAIQESLGRKTYVSTVAWLLDSPEKIKNSIRTNVSGDLEELTAVVKSVIRKFEQVTAGRKYEVWFRRPQHDVPLLSHLFEMLGLELPWNYNCVNDLASIMTIANLSHTDVEVPAGNVPHDALHDNRFQLACYAETLRHLRSRS